VDARRAFRLLAPAMGEIDPDAARGLTVVGRRGDGGLKASLLSVVHHRKDSGMPSDPPPNNLPIWVEVLSGFIVIFGVSLALAMFVDTLGDLVKDEVKAWIDSRHHPAVSATVVGLCGVAIWFLLVAIAKIIDKLEEKRLERMAICGALLLAPVFGLEASIADKLETVITYWFPPGAPCLTIRSFDLGGIGILAFYYTQV
jgi:hypothetical protein